MPTDLRLSGICHHDPSRRHALDEFRPDLVLLECPADTALATARCINLNTT